MYGLPADTVRHKYTRKAAAPHPFWNEEPFTFKRVREGGRGGRDGGEGERGGREGVCVCMHCTFYIHVYMSYV